MASRRTLKAAEAIRQVVSTAILTQVRDPRIENVTVLSVEVSGDMRLAKVNVSIMGDDKKQQLALRGLESSSGFLQQLVSNRIDTRYTPKLQFVLDHGVKNAIAIAEVLEKVLPSSLEEPPAQEGEAPQAESMEPPPVGQTRSGPETVD